MQGFSAESHHRFGPQFLHIGRHIVKRLRPEKETVLRPVYPFCDPQKLMQPGMGVEGGKAIIPGPAFRIKTEADGDPLKQRRFAHAIFTDHISHIGMQIQFPEIPDDRKVQGIFVIGIDSFPFQRNPFDILGIRIQFQFVQRSSFLLLADLP